MTPSLRGARLLALMRSRFFIALMFHTPICHGSWALLFTRPYEYTSRDPADGLLVLTPPGIPADGKKASRMRHSRSGEGSLIRLRARNDTGPEAIIARQRLLLVDLRPRGGDGGDPGSLILYAHCDREERKEASNLVKTAGGS